MYSDGYSLRFSYVRLDDHRMSDIPQSLPSELAEGLDAARSAGVEVILRFAYNEGPYPSSEPDAPRDRILAHIAQVQPLLAEHEDVIAAVQAGFIGAWGEWHASTNGRANAEDEQVVLEALLDATPVSRSVHVRYPPDKAAIYGSPLTPTTAFSGSHAARTGHHNDCFLSSDTDVGTYPSGEVAKYKDYLAQDTRFVPMGGETCAVHARGSCSTATSEMAQLHFSYLNRDFHRDVIDGWISGGCYEEIHRSLGYRLALVQASIPRRARPGGAFEIDVEISNQGWAAPFNPRLMQVVLVRDQTAVRATAATVDPRRWLPESPVTLRVEVRLPTSLSPGDYQLGLALPDPAPRLSDRPEYAVRFANAGTWLSATGVNVLGTLTVDETAPGGASSTSTELVATVRSGPVDPRAR